MTMIRSARSTVARRWAMTIVVSWTGSARRRRICAATSYVGLSPSNSRSSEPRMPAGPMEASDVDCAAEAPQGGLMECLGQGWVGVDGPGHVLEKCPHFDGQCELSDEFRNMGADRLDAEHAMIVAAGDHANESTVFRRLHA